LIINQKENNMKSIKYIIGLVVGCMLLSSCVDEMGLSNTTNIIDGIPTSVKLAFESPIPVSVDTKAALNTEAEYHVSNLYLFVFNSETGKKEIGRLFDTNSGLNVDNKKVYEGDETTCGHVVLSVPSGKKVIYAVANVPETTSLMTLSENPDSESSLEVLNNIEQLSELKDLAVRMNRNTIFRQSGNLLMSGYLDTGSGSADGYCEISPSTSTLTFSTIKLQRLDARVTFNIGVGNADITFKPLKYRVLNVPLTSNLYRKTCLNAGNDQDDNYFSQTKNEAANFESVVDGKSTFTFYTLENGSVIDQSIAYKDRELEHKAPDGTNTGNYIYAPQYSTFVEMTGEYYESYNENGHAKERSADVTYTIHLGYVGDNAKDFRTERNVAYTYNVTVEGIDNIRLEVTTGTTENQPGAEGHIVETDKFMQFDAHYEMDLLVISKDALEGRAGFRVKTPYDEDYYVLSREESAVGKLAEEAIDYEWVKFVRNDTYTSEDRVYYYTDRYKPYPQASAGTILTINQLLEELKVEANYDGNNEIVYTVFIDEYYYSNESWQTYVNAPNREMHILCNTGYSKDRESSLTTSSIMISQRSIKSVYNVNASGLTTAWGTESVNETGRLTPPKSNPWDRGNFSQSDGRWNFFSQLSLGNSPFWNTYITHNINNSNASDHLVTGSNDDALKRRLRSACLQRNRDENGDGKIDATEVKWFPASLNELIDIWMGKDGLPSEAHLYPNGSMEYWRYLSSDGKELYAEEGSAFNEYKFIYKNSLPAGTADPSTYDYRCIRRIETSLSAPAKNSNMPQDYVIHDKNRRIFYLQYMNESSLRPAGDYTEEEFAVHTELDPINRPFLQFEYAEKTIDKEVISWYAKNEKVTNGKSPCKNLPGTGWRLPNQRELSLIGARCGMDGGWGSGVSNWSRTTSTLPMKVNLGYSFNNQGQMTIPASKFTGTVRCVRDVK